MATILEFRGSGARSGAAKPTKGRRASAEVIIFPGIRVEYHDEPAPPRQEERRRAKRDTLDIID